MAFSLESSAFKEGESIPPKYTCEGDDISPPLTWKHPPPKTVSFALIMDDPDAPKKVWDHWAVFNIPNTVNALNENHSFRDDTIVGKNSWGKNKYGGPCPPSGEHRYFFKLYALDKTLSLSTEATKKNILEAMDKHVLGTAELMGRYKKKS